MWTYDAAGNITSKKEYAYTATALGTVLDTITYGYDSTWGDKLISYDGKTITYDAIGNPLYDGKWSYTWAQGRQLAQMSYGSNVWTFTYDADGMRTGRSNLGNASYTYVYNGSQLIQMNSSSSGIMRFTYGADGSPLTITYNGTTYYYVTNMQGDVVAIVDSSGAMVVEYTYDAWGRLLSTTGDDALVLTLGLHNPLRYRGYVYDRETGLYYLQSRYYNPTTGRFINADNYPSTGQGLLGNNMFAYCGNNPVSRGDDDGEAWHILIGAVVGAIAGVVGQVISDVVTSAIEGEVKISNWQTYAGAAVGGAAGGVVLATTGNMNAANAVTGALTTGVGQSLEKLTIKGYNKSWGEIAGNTVADGFISYGLGKIPGIKGATAGRNSWSAVYKSGLTKLRNHTASRMSTKVIAKGIGSSIIGGFALDGYYGVKQHAYDRTKSRLFA